MKIVRGTKNIVGPISYPVVAIGNFDGVHIGHQIIFRKAVELACANEGTAIAFTFEPHPLKVTAPKKAPLLLTTFRKKMELMGHCGEIEFRLTEGSDEFIQLEALLSKFALKGCDHGKED